ncbi:hypothetical protein LCGC14_1316070 [marine sediment metagenome]|uniref:Uncharacterized protein n=1 Tax=marine sediment metagenome TaxID=412755 RepID=A0A0F9KL14_9ZZZZ|nr:hypothetical protein [bacterium]
MTILNNDSERKRAQFTQEILDDIRNAPGYCSFYSYVSNRMMALGLQRKAKETGLFENVYWSNPANKEGLIRKIEKFLVEHIK